MRKKIIKTLAKGGDNKEDDVHIDLNVDGLPIHVRNLAIGDLAECYDIGEMAFTPEKTGTTLYRTWDEATLVETFLSDSELCLVAIVGANTKKSRVVGFILCEVMKKKKEVVGYISWVCMRESYRRRGIGQELVDICCQNLKDREKVEAIIADTSAVNQGAIEFFKHVGFTNAIEHVYYELNISEYAKKFAEGNPSEPKPKRQRVRGKPTCKVREVELKDLKTIYELGEAVFTRDMDNLYRSWTEDEVVSFLVADWEFCFVAELGGKVVGFAFGNIIEKNSWKYGYLVWMGVDPKTQGAGVGRKLFETFRDSVAKSGARLLLLDTQSSNEPARRFFTKLGFKESEQHYYYSRSINWDEQDMNRIITSSA